MKDLYLGLIAFIAMSFCFIAIQSPYPEPNYIHITTNSIQKVEKPKETIQDKITRMSKEYGIDTETALRIAECESQFGKYPKNWEGSSASGVYQFTSGTWDNYCEGDVLNEDDNIKCFMELYNKYPYWWACN